MLIYPSDSGGGGFGSCGRNTPKIDGVIYGVDNSATMHRVIFNSKKSSDKFWGQLVPRPINIFELNSFAIRGGWESEIDQTQIIFKLISNLGSQGEIDTF